MSDATLWACTHCGNVVAMFQYGRPDHDYCPGCEHPEPRWKKAGGVSR